MPLQEMMDSVDDYGDPNWEPEPVDAGPGGWFICFFASPPSFLVVEFRFTRLNLSCIFSPSIHLGHVLSLDVILFTWLDLFFSLDMVISIRSPWSCLHSTRSCPSFTLGMSFIQFAHAPFWLCHILFALLITSFHLPLTLSSPLAHCALSPFPHRIPNKQAKRRGQHASQHMRLKRSFCERAAGPACAPSFGYQRWELREG